MHPNKCKYDEAKASFPRVPANKCERKKPMPDLHRSERSECGARMVLLYCCPCPIVANSSLRLAGA